VWLGSSSGVDKDDTHISRSVTDSSSGGCPGTVAREANSFR
jgi:hypothetical protein